MIRKRLLHITPYAILVPLLLCIQSCNEKTNVQTPSLFDETSVVKVNLEKWPKQISPIVDNNATERQVDQLLTKMTLEEKVGQIIQADIASVTPEDVKAYHLGSVLNGGNSAPHNDNRTAAENWLQLADEFWLASTDTSNGRTAIPVIWGTDAVHGHSNVVGATIFPHNIGLGAANDPELMRAIGRVTATEMLVTGLDWTFAPTLAVARNDRWGRTYESYSEDPAIVNSFVAPLLEGIQGKLGTAEYLDQHHMLATVKHFLGDGGTLSGKDQGENVSTEEQLRDLHASPYYEAVKAGAQVVMASYNSWHEKKMHGSKPFLTDILVDRIGLNGFVVGDWNAHGQVAGCSTTSCPQSFNAGLDLFMAPDSWKSLYANTLAQVKDGTITQARLDQAVARILRVKIRMGLFEAGLPSKRPLAGQLAILGSPEHRSVAREAVRKSLVLLKNEDQLLPLNPRIRIGVAGDGAHNIGKQSGGWTLSWQGTGNENHHFPNGTSIYQGLEQAVNSAGGQIEYSHNGEFSQKPDVAIVVFGEEPYAEFQGDIEHLDFEDDAGLMLLADLKRQGIPTVSIFISGRPLWVNPEINQSDAFVAAWLPGSEGAGIADVILQKPDGSVNHDFTGKLSFSWPNNATENELNLGDPHYQPLFAFGYGLTYDDKGDLAQLSENSGLSNDQLKGLTSLVYAGKAARSWKIQLFDGGKSTDVTNPSQLSAHRSLTIKSSDFRRQEDTSIVSWSNKGSLVVSPKNSSRLDLTEALLDNLALEIEYQILAASNESVHIGMACGNNCGGHIDITDAVQQKQGNGWFKSKIMLDCFAQRGAAMSKITAPAVITGNRGLKIQIANIGILSTTKKESCSL